MSVVHIVDTVTEWVQEHICQGIKLKVPPSDESAATDAGYEYSLVTPTAFSLFVPAKDKLPPSIISPLPSVCVRILDGADDLGSVRGSIGLQLSFSTWDPGIHGKDILKPVKGENNAFEQWTGAEAEAYFRKNGGGWRDAWNWVDIALREIESTTYIGDYAIDRTGGVKYGPLTEQESIPDYYPFWFAWVNFRLTYPLFRNNDEVLKFL